MTPAQHALAEAAREESARVYGQVQREHRAALPPPAPDPSAAFEMLVEAVQAGVPNSRIMIEHEVDYDTLRRARKIAMRRVA